MARRRFLNLSRRAFRLSSLSSRGSRFETFRNFPLSLAVQFSGTYQNEPFGALLTFLAICGHQCISSAHLSKNRQLFHRDLKNMTVIPYSIRANLSCGTFLILVFPDIIIRPPASANLLIHGTSLFGTQSSSCGCGVYFLALSISKLPVSFFNCRSVAKVSKTLTIDAGIFSSNAIFTLPCVATLRSPQPRVLVSLESRT